ncbi:MAG: hypothetical protein VX612_12825 [Pseudomonadota bacterium]|nr:hypothetical protein [Pseudomonadota bacterium]
MTSFPLLAQPLTVGAVTLANRMVMGSMHTNLEGNPGHFDQLGRFYAARAAGAAAGPVAEVLTAARLRRVYGVEAELTRGADGRPRVTPLRAV